MCHKFLWVYGKIRCLQHSLNLRRMESYPRDKIVDIFSWLREVSTSESFPRVPIGNVGERSKKESPVFTGLEEERGYLPSVPIGNVGRVMGNGWRWLFVKFSQKEVPVFVIISIFA